MHYFDFFTRMPGDISQWVFISHYGGEAWVLRGYDPFDLVHLEQNLYKVSKATYQQGLSMMSKSGLYPKLIYSDFAKQLDHPNAFPKSTDYTSYKRR
jgi:hypothetical protein